MNVAFGQRTVARLMRMQSPVRRIALLLSIASLCQGMVSAQSSPSTTQYQAAAPGNTLVGNAAVAACASCPGGVKVGSLGFGSAVIFNNVSAPATGNYTLTIVGQRSRQE